MKVLVVEDAVELAALVRVSLEREGWDVDLAYDGHQALGKVSSSHDLVLVDLGLPDMSGESMVERMRSNPEFDSAHVVWFTAQKNPAVPPGGLGVVNKPFDPMGLASQLLKLLP